MEAHLLLLLYYFILSYVYGYIFRMYVCAHVHAWYPQGPEGAVISPETGVTDC